MLRAVLFVTLAVWASFSFLAEARGPIDRPNKCDKKGFCKNDGHCSFDAKGQPKCTCASGFAGVRCEFPIDACSKTPCLNNATCSLISLATRTEPSQFNCTCTEGFIGTRCQFPRDPCSKTPCHNNGTCSLISEANLTAPAQFNCSCPEGFIGSRCQFSTDPCELKLCQNHAMCSQVSSNTIDEDTKNNTIIRKLVVGNFTCTCQSDNTTGPLCENLIDPCLRNPCKNGGTCSLLSKGTYNREGRYRCTCPEGFEGKRCKSVCIACNYFDTTRQYSGSYKFKKI